MFIFHIPCHSGHLLPPKATQTWSRVFFVPFQKYGRVRFSESKMAPSPLCEFGAQRRNTIQKAGIGPEHSPFKSVQFGLENVNLGLQTGEMTNSSSQNQKTTGHARRAGLFWHEGEGVDLSPRGTPEWAKGLVTSTPTPLWDKSLGTREEGMREVSECHFNLHGKKEGRKKAGCCPPQSCSFTKPWFPQGMLAFCSPRFGSQWHRLQWRLAGRKVLGNTVRTEACGGTKEVGSGRGEVNRLQWGPQLIPRPCAMALGEQWGWGYAAL